MDVAPASPLQHDQRIQYLDVLRGVAVLGILMMNMPYYAHSHYIGSNLDVRQEYSGPDYYTWWVVEGLFEGTMRALFSMLFGAGTLLLADRLLQNGKKDAARIYRSRMLWLFLFGLFHAYLLLYRGDILTAYAVCGLLLFPLAEAESGVPARHRALPVAAAEYHRNL